MFGPDALRHAEQPLIDRQRIDPAKGGENRAQLESQKPITVPTEGGVTGDDVVVGLSGETVALKDHGSSAARADRLALPKDGVAVEGGTGRIADEGPGDERSAGQHGARLVQDATACRLVEQIDVARIHVDGGSEPGGGRALDVGSERGPIDGASPCERQQDGRDAGDAAARTQEFDGIEREFGHEGCSGATPFASGGKGSVKFSGNFTRSDSR